MLINHLLRTENINKKIYGVIRTIVFSFGMITLSLGLVLPRFFHGNHIDFISGFFIGISIVANIVSIVLIKKCKKG